MQVYPPAQSTYLNRQSMFEMFQSSYKNYAYRMLELEISIDQVGFSIGRNKKQDISELIQLYMIGVEVLESTSDPRFAYFRTKLHDLMLKKQVIRTLKFTTPEDIIKKEKEIREQKRKQHETILAKNKQIETKQASSIIHTAATVVQNYKQSFQNTLKKQQNQIKQRLSSRGKRSQLSLKKQSILKKQAINVPKNPSSEYYSPAPLSKTNKQSRQISPKAISIQNNSNIQKPKIPKPSIIHREPKQ